MGLIKFSSTDDFKSDVIPVSVITDYNQLVKRSGSERFKHELRKVAKDQTPVHLIALSAYESTGCNRNFDLFKESSCKEYHHTFVKAGRAVHHNHINRGNDPKYGNIYASDYNVPMKRIELLIGLDNNALKNAATIQKLVNGQKVAFSMACKIPFDKCTWCDHKASDSAHRCFVAGTLIETSKGQQKIENIVVGDIVKTHTGKWKKVLTVFKQEYCGEFYDINVVGLPKSITSTATHPFYVGYNHDIYIPNGTNSGRKDIFYSLTSPTHKNKIIYPHWISAENLKVDDFCTYPCNTWSPVKYFDEDEAYFLGAFVGDGNIDNHNVKCNGLCFTCATHEPEIKNKFIEIGKKLFIKPSYFYQPKKRPDVGYLYFYEREYASFVKENFGEYSKQKFISSVVNDWSDEAKISFLAGYIDTDGSIGHLNQIEIASVNYGLMLSIRVILNSLGIISRITKSKYGKNSYGANAKIKQVYSYEIIISSYYADIFKEKSIKVKNKNIVKSKRLMKKSFFNNHNFFQRIRDIHTYLGNELVYNLEVEEDNSYIANGVVVHNCEHIPRDLGTITKDGTVCAMDNCDPVDWFEISIVRSPADRIAYSLNNIKEASDQDSPQSRYITNQKLAQEIYVPPPISLSKFASEKRSLLDKISKMEKHIDAVANGKVVDSKDKYIKDHASKLNASPELSEKTISELRSFDHNQLLKALADKGIIFNPEEFVKYIFNNNVKEETIDGMKSHLPNIFNELKSNDEEINSDDFQPEGKVPDFIKNLIKDLEGDHSLFGAPAHARIMKITLIRKVPGELKKESSFKSDSLLEKNLALKYANYKLSALNYINENNQLDDELIINSLIQNRR